MSIEALSKTPAPSLWSRARALVLGPSGPKRLPERVRRAIQEQEETSEILVTVIQLGAIATFALLYALAPRAFTAEVRYEIVPFALGIYALFTLWRLRLALKRRLPAWFVRLSVVVDIVFLLTTIWSFHLQYGTPPALYLKAPTLMYVFILIALRALRFDPGLVALAGVTAALGWLGLVLYVVFAGQSCDAMALLEAVLGAEACGITHMYPTYMMSYDILLGAEFDKIVSILMVTLILALALLRARVILVRASTEHAAATEMARFFAPEVAGRIRATEAAIEPGQAELREAAILMTDLRGFTALTDALRPAEVMQVLAAYQTRVVAVVREHGGSIDKFMGDGILASFGATRPSACYAADALRALEALQAVITAWAAERAAAGLPVLRVGAALATGPVMFGAIGDASRLEYTVIGDAVNLAAKLEKHTKAERARALCPAATYALAEAQGFAAGAAWQPRPERRVAGVGQPLDLMVLG